VTVTLKLVTRDDPNDVVFDFDDDTGLENPLGIKTFLTDIDLGEVDRPIDLVKAKGAVLSTRAISDPQPRIVTIGLVVDAPNRTMATLASGLDQLFSYLMAESAADRLLAWNDGSGVRFFEPIGLEKASPSLQSSNSEPNVAFGTDPNLVLEIKCQPYIVSSQLDSDVNVVVNSTLGVEGTTANRPDSWDWDSLTGLSAESIDETEDAYTITFATTGTRNLQQTTPAGTATSGNTYTDSIYVKAAASGIVQAQMVIRFCDSGGTPLGTETVGSLTSIGPVWTRLSVAAAAPASTSRILVTLRFANTASTSCQVWIRDAQAEHAASASPFRCGYHVINADASVPYGSMFPLVVLGSGPTPVTFDVEAEASPGNAKLTSIVMGARWNEGVDGTNEILDYQNESHWVPAGTTEAGWNVTTENLGGGGTNSDSDAFSANGLTLSIGDGNVDVKLRRWRAVRTTNLDSLRGEWTVYGRFDARESDAEWSMQLRYGSANIDPVPYTNDAGTITVENQSDSIDTTLTPYDYVNLGTMKIPDSGPIGAVRVELWIKRADNATIGTANLRFGGLLIVPRTPSSTISLPGVGKTQWTDAELDLTTPKLAADGSGNFDTGTRLDGGAIRLDRNGQAMGVKPSTGQAYGTGRVRVAFSVKALGFSGALGEIIGGISGMVIRVVRISGGSGQAIMVRRGVNNPKTYSIEFDANAGELYIPQALHKGANGERFTIDEIDQRFVPYVDGSLLDRVVSDPERLEVTKRDSSLNVQVLCDVEGQTPFILEPGRYVIVVMPGELKQPGHDGDNSPLNRTYKVRTRYSPRWTQ
jgi:hypothetical protein